MLVTDYGTADTYAGALVGACWRVEPELRIAHGTHGVPPGDVLAGAYHVAAVALAFPERSVVCAVVDPGVGTDRRAIAVDTGVVRCVAPDNGLVSYLWRDADPSVRRCVAIAVPRRVAATFHGRDVFAPAAAALAAGDELDDLGDPVDAPVVLDAAFARRDGDTVAGRVILHDRFGNAVTTVRASDLSGRPAAGASWPGGATTRVVRTYAEIGEGVAVLAGSAGHLEVAARARPAAELGGPPVGAEIRVRIA